jgi:hypothetical protein
MKVFIWENLDDITPNWHDGGGVLVVAETVEAKRQIPRRGSDPDSIPDPDHTWPVTADPRVIVFPDSGCC